MEIGIIGGAGYIGSHVVLEALERGHEVTVFDDLSTGSKKNIQKNTHFIHGSTLSLSNLDEMFNYKKYDAIIHLAASKAAGESMNNPIKYSRNNIIGGLNLIESCIGNDVKIFIFSSSAAVYGEPKYIPIDELHSLDPSNYYGYTKLCLERNLAWMSKLSLIKYGSLRYFNAAGFDIKNRIKQLEKNPQNLIPIIMETAAGLRPEVEIYGNKFNTSDGTGIRDYIHVGDLAKAHLDTVDFIKNEQKNVTINLGTSHGYSVLDVLKQASKIINKNIKYRFVNHRKGDPGIVISECSLAKKLIGWDPKYSNLNTIISSTWELYK
tara:strand:- start:2672 stop:3637 length:966 start_codon:yes stop_codon:yes gene_type:complete